MTGRLAMGGPFCLAQLRCGRLYAMEAIEYPTITLGDPPRVAPEEFTVRYRAGDIIRLKKNHNINLLGKMEFNLSEGLDTSMAILAAGVAHQKQFTVEEIADLVDFACIGEVIAGILEAVGKVSDRSRALLIQAMKRVEDLKIQQAPVTESTPVN